MNPGNTPKVVLKQTSTTQTIDFIQDKVSNPSDDPNEATLIPSDGLDDNGDKYDDEKDDCDENKNCSDDDKKNDFELGEIAQNIEATVKNLPDKIEIYLNQVITINLKKK